MRSPLIRKVTIVASLVLLGVANLHAIDIEDAIELLQDRALVVRIIARVTEQGRETVWNMELTEITISGRAVQIQLEGGGMTARAQFTPYASDQSITLVAQGQTWVTSEDSSEVTYRSAFESLPVTFGEPVIFFPLGEQRPGHSDALNIELEVRIEAFQQTSLN
ncbi:MAG: hypothetical protein EA383_16880 [Spirochaetaceae bacterium]|nr:MAG: hypothetical protein EA383_16880 [Spirochaetaceae bacterium]